MIRRIFNDSVIGAFCLGVHDALEQHGQLSSGRSSDTDDDWNEAYDTGANVGEWLHDLATFNNVMRWPWVMRKEN